jgi:hypothetical protein
MDKTMKITVILLTVFIVLMTGCNKDVINMMSQGTRRDVFEETSGGVPIPRGYAELTIISSLKTHKPGIYPYGNRVRGTSDYVLLINIDGQKTVIKGDLEEEKTELKGLYNQEAGEGIRYFYEKEILIKPGKHRMILAPQEESFVVERELTFKDETNNILRPEPIYGSSNPRGTHGRIPRSYSSFMAGIEGFWVYLNGNRF